MSAILNPNYYSIQKELNTYKCCEECNKKTLKDEMRMKDELLVCEECVEQESV